MSPETETSLALTLAVLRMLQDSGDAPPPGQVSPEYIARLSMEIDEPVSATTIRRIESRMTTKLRHQLSNQNPDPRPSAAIRGRTQPQKPKP